ncbi:MAG: hypothetical protein ACPH97_03315, partial [Flavobacteriales bacterium]
LGAVSSIAPHSSKEPSPLNTPLCRAGKDAAKSAAPLTPPSSSETSKPAHAAPGNGGECSVLGVGDTVMHAKFGKGKVLALEGAAPNEKATVFFPSVGQKQLLLKFAKLEVVG